MIIKFVLVASFFIFVVPVSAHQKDKPHSGGWDKMMGRSESARELGDWNSAIGYLKHAKESATGGLPLAVTHLQLAEALAINGNYEEAGEAAKKGLGTGALLDPLPQIRGQLLEVLAFIRHKKGGSPNEVQRLITESKKIRETNQSPFVPRSHDYGLRHSATGFLFLAKISELSRTSVKKIQARLPHVKGKYAKWLGKSAISAEVIIYPKQKMALRQIFDQVRSLILQSYKYARTHSKGRYNIAKIHGLKGLQAQWLINEPKKKIGFWAGLYLIERKDFIFQVNARSQVEEIERATKLIDNFVRGFKWARPIKG